MKRTFASLLCLLILLIGGTVPAMARATAQEGDSALTLRLRRDFGYGSGAQMQGRFSFRVEAPADVERVEFLLDGEVVGEDGESPFRLAFSTGNYDEGWHTLSAVGYTAAGDVLQSNSLQRQFVPARQTFAYTGAILLLVFVFIVARYLMTRPRGRDASGEKRRSYGFLGGAICPRCGLPFPLPIWSGNLMAGRIARCPHCGKWSFVQRATPEALARAEAFAAEPAGTAGVVEGEQPDEEERLRRRLDDSRYDSG